jgi:hypothetical protein
MLESLYTKENSRYPFTFACDFVRMAGLAHSRADASILLGKLADFVGLEHREMAEKVANQYIDYYAGLHELETKKEAMFIALRNGIEEMNKENPDA